MAQKELKEPKDAVKRNIILTGYITKYLLDNPHVFDSLPDDFELVVVSDDDPDISAYSLRLLTKYGSGGKPVIRGTRIPIELLLRKLSEGATEHDLLDAYPRLTPEDIRAALAFAADTL